MPDAARLFLISKAARLQIVMLIAMLPLCLFAPHGGGAVLLVPLRARTDVLAVLNHHTAVLGQGRIAGSLLVRIKGDVPVMALLRQGILPLGGPASLCGPANTIFTQPGT